MISEAHNTYTIRQLSWNNLQDGAIQMNELIDGFLDGFVIKDFISPEEVRQIIAGFRNLNQTDLIHINDSFDSYPMTFAQYDQMTERGLLKPKDYFTKSEQFINSFESKFGVKVFERLQNVFKDIRNAPTVEIPMDKSNNGKYVPFTFRELFVGEGSLKAHCENLFFKEFPSFFNKINSFSTLENQLSFFIVLQKPEQGGELTLFDILWDNGQNRPNDDEIVLQNGTINKFDDLNSIKRDTIHPQPGSLVVFSGGKIWHRVEKVKKEPSRITLGGFLSFSHDKKTLYCWS